MTHGSIRVEQDDHFIHLHTTHTGHLRERIEVAFHLPYRLFLEMHRRQHYVLDILMLHRTATGRVPQREVEYDDVLRNFQLMARSCMCDVHSLANYLASARLDYLFVLPKTSAQKGTLEYWNYGGDVLTVYGNEPDQDMYTIDVVPEIAERQDEEGLQDDLVQMCRETNASLGDEFYIASGTQVHVPMKKVIAQLVVDCLRGNLEAPPKSGALHHEYKRYFLEEEAPAHIPAFPK